MFQQIQSIQDNNPFLSLPILSKKIQKEQEIICKNQELFNVNQSKSIYLSKITQLIDTEIAPKQRVTDKMKRKMQQQLESSDDQFQGDLHQQKLARNRQSARDSRKRKKIYIELLENKVEELFQEIARLEAIIQNQNQYMHQCCKIPSMIKEFHLQYQNQLQGLKCNSTLENLKSLDNEFGASSLRRMELCASFFNTLIDFTIPSDLKKIMESAVKGFDLFQEQTMVSGFWTDKMQEQWKSLKKEDIQNVKDKILEETNRLEFYMFDFTKNYEKIRQQCSILDQFKDIIITMLSPPLYSQYILNIDFNQIKEEEFC